jgi:iron complex outermembrane receptor protein
LSKLSLIPVSLVWALAAAGAPALAQAPAPELAAAPPVDTTATDETALVHAAGGGADATDPTTKGKKQEIVVIADRIKGQVDAPQKPIAEFSEEDIAAYGVSSVSDLLDAISPQTGSGRGRGSTQPVILVNGQRITNFREMMNYPPEAIRKVEVLPEEVALRFGYSPDQRVVNFILKDNFQARSLEAEYSGSDSGGTGTAQGTATLLRIDHGKRLNMTAKADTTSRLTEAERGVSQGTQPTVASDPNPANYRTLVASKQNYSLNGTLTAPMGKGGLDGNMTINGLFSRADSESWSGLNTYTPSSGVVRTFAGPLTTNTRTDTYSAGAGLNRNLLNWNLSATMDVSHVEASTVVANRVTDNAVLAAALASGTSPSGAYTTTRSNSDTMSSMVTIVGRPVQLPAGKMAVTGKLGFAYSALAGSSDAVGAVSSSLRRGDASAQVNLGIPITSTREQFGAFLGDISANLSIGGNRLSDFGWLTNWNGGLNWNITTKLGLQGSYLYSEAAPSLSNLGSPLVVTYNASVYDFVKQQTVLATVTTGGNSALQRERRNDIKLGLNWTLPGLQDSTRLVVEYFNNRSNNVTSAFPTTLTSDLESAFAGRVTRNSAGVITAIDRRAITLAETRDEHIRWGLNIGGTLGKEIKSTRGAFGGPMGGPPPGGGAGGPPPGGGAGGPPGGGGGPGGPGGPPGGRQGRFEGRWNVSLYHTVNFVNRVQVAENGPVLNLLGGDTLSASGTARHSLEGEGGFFYKGFGARFNGTWTAPTHVDSGTTDLRFGALFKVTARLFADLGQQKSLVEKAPFFKDTRVSIGAKNLFNQRQRVTDQNGNTPTNYLPAYMDPNGRILNIEFRKMF